MARQPHHDDSPTLIRRAVEYTDQLAKWPKRVAGVLWLLGVVGALGFWIPQGLRILKGYGPLEGRVQSHLGEYSEHTEAFESHEAAHQGEHQEIHQLTDTILRAIGGLKAQTDTLRTEQRWEACIRQRAADLEAGRLPRECGPFGGAP